MRVGWIIDGTLHIENKWGAQELYQPALVILVLAYLCALHLAILTLFSLNLSNCWLARFIQLNFVLLLEFYIRVVVFLSSYHLLRILVGFFFFSVLRISRLS